jgi:hypothetical protein
MHDSDVDMKESSSNANRNCSTLKKQKASNVWLRGNCIIQNKESAEKSTDWSQWLNEKNSKSKRIILVMGGKL